MRNSLMHTPSQAAQPYSNKHVIQNFLKPPSHLRNVPTYCTKQLNEGGQRAAAVFCCALRKAESRPGRRTAESNVRRLRLSYLGSSLSATPLCIWNALVLSRFFFFPQKSMFLQIWQLNFWLCARILTCSLYWMETWLGQQVLRTGAAHCEPPESAASPPHQRFLKAYSHMAPVPHSLLRSDRATSCSCADRHIIHLYLHTYCECRIVLTFGLDAQEGVKQKTSIAKKTSPQYTANNQISARCYPKAVQEIQTIILTIVKIFYILPLQITWYDLRGITSWSVVCSCLLPLQKAHTYKYFR